jgi:hypothetical protein
VPLQICQRHRLHHEWFERLAHKVCAVSPPCMSDAEDWEGAAVGVGGSWAMEIDLLVRMQVEGGGVHQPHLPETGERAQRSVGRSTAFGAEVRLHRT